MRVCGVVHTAGSTYTTLHTHVNMCTYFCWKELCTCTVRF